MRSHTQLSPNDDIVSKIRPRFLRMTGPRGERGDRLGPSRYCNRHNFGYVLAMDITDGLMHFCGGLDINKELTLWRETRFIVNSRPLRVAQQPNVVHHIIKWRQKAMKLDRFCRGIQQRSKVWALEMCLSHRIQRMCV